MRRSGKAKPVVWRWQARFMAEGVPGLTRDKTRKPGKPPLPVAPVRRMVDLAVMRVHFERAAPKRHFGRSTKGSLCGGQARCRKSITRTVARRRCRGHRCRDCSSLGTPPISYCESGMMVHGMSNIRTPNSFGFGASHGDALKTVCAADVPCCHSLCIEERLKS